MWKINLSILFLVLVLALTIYQSLLLSTLDDNIESKELGQEDPSAVTVQHLEDFSYYALNKGLNQLELIGEFGELPQIGPVKVRSPKGHAYPTNAPSFSFTSDHGELDSLKGAVTLRGRVVVLSLRDDLRGDYALYDFTNQAIFMEGQVQAIHLNEKTPDKIWINSQKAQGHLGREEYKFYGNVWGKIEPAKKYEDPIFYKAQEAHALFQQNEIRLTGPVWIQQNRFEAQSLKGQIFLESLNKKLKYYVLYDDVRLKQEVLVARTGIPRKAQGERLEGLVQERKVILSGNPRLYQGESIVRGSEIVLYQDSDIVEAINADSKIELKKDDN